ncbi:MAG: hypothetical protein WD533_00590 [Dehalococcoidia bacterium]
MEITLERLVNDFARALEEMDQRGLSHKQFQPGIGPFGEAEAVRGALEALKRNKPERYREAAIKRQPDLLIPDQWQLEFKILRPFGDNGREAEHWSQNLLHPYAGNTSSIGDALKLLHSAGPERKGIIVFGYEHAEPRISLEPCIQGFELLATGLFGFEFAATASATVDGLIHPVHQVLKVFGWELSTSRA